MIATRVLLLALIAFAACGGDDAPSGPGPETHVPTTPPPSGSDVTSTTCSESSSCEYWYCRCEDGAVVNASYCNNGLCSEASAICPAACEAFAHGGWTGVAGGGPTQPSETSCGGFGSSNESCRQCGDRECCSEGEACGDDPGCLDHWDCVVSCGGSSSCREECEAGADPDGRTKYEAFESCLVSACSDSCPG